MAKRTENRIVRIEKPLDINVHTCDSCGVEVATSRDVYFGDERLVVEGDEHPWFQVASRAVRQDYSAGTTLDFCSAKCVAAWAARMEVSIG